MLLLHQGRSQGGGDMGVRTPSFGPNFVVIFTKTLTKRRSGAYPQHFRTLRTPPLAISGLKTPSLGHFWLRPWLAVSSNFSLGFFFSFSASQTFFAYYIGLKDVVGDNNISSYKWLRDGS